MVEMFPKSLYREHAGTYKEHAFVKYWKSELLFQQVDTV